MVVAINRSRRNVSIDLYRTSKIPKGIEFKKVSQAQVNSLIPEYIRNSDVIFCSNNDYELLTSSMLKYLSDGHIMTTQQNRSALEQLCLGLTSSVEKGGDMQGNDELSEVLGELNQLMKAFHSRGSSTYIV